MMTWPWWNACTGYAFVLVAWHLYQKDSLLHNSHGAGPFFGVPSNRRCVRSTSLRQVDMARLTVGPTVGFCGSARKGIPLSFTSVPHSRLVNHAYISRSGSCGFSPSRFAVSFRASSRTPVHILCRVVHCAQIVLRVDKVRAPCTVTSKAYNVLTTHARLILS